MSEERAEPVLHGGRFRLDGILGEGGMGVVYRATDVRTGGVVALKTMARVDAEALLRFKNEFRSLADIAHVNLVSLHDLMVDGEQWFFTMELIEGVSFLEWVQDQTRFTAPTEKSLTEIRSLATQTQIAPPPTENEAAPRSVQTNRLPEMLVGDVERLRDALRQLAAGVSAIHGAGKLHRDIKPSNILVEAGGRLVLLDFGVVGDIGGAGHEQQVLGTPAYMAPEQACGKGVRAASDWYAVGALLYESLTNQVPFEGPAVDMLQRRQVAAPMAPSEIVEGVPPDLDVICQGLLLPNPDDRLSGDAVLQLLGSGRTTAPALSERQQPLPLFGRDAEVARLLQAVERTHDAPSVILVHGGAGTGKSALVRELLTRLQRRPEVALAAATPVVLQGRCHEREAVPFKAFDSVVDELSRTLTQLPPAEVVSYLPLRLAELARVFPVLRNVKAVELMPEPAHPTKDPREVRRLAFGQLKELLRNVAKSRPLVVYVDDFHWSDLDSLRLLEALLTPPAPALALILGYRDSGTKVADTWGAPVSGTRTTRREGGLPALKEMHSVLEELGLTAAGQVIDLELGPLSESEAVRAAQASLRDDNTSARALAAAIAEQAQGVPFIISELAEWELELRARGAAPTSEPSLQRMLAGRLDALPETARPLLEAIAIAGSPVTLGVAAAAAGLEDPRGAARSLRSARLIRARGHETTDLAELVHGNLREALVRSLSAEEQVARHAALAAALETQGAEPARVLDHALAASDRERARRLVLPAAAAAERALAFERAAELHQLALELDAPAARHELHARAAAALANAGRTEKAAEHFAKAADARAGDERVELLRLAAENYLKAGREADGLGTLARVLREVELRMPSTVAGSLSSLLYHRAKLRLRGTRHTPRRAGEIPLKALQRVDAAFSATVGLALLDVIAGADFAARHLLLALEAGEPIRVCRALALEAANSAAVSDSSRDRVERLVRTAEGLAMRVDDPKGQALARMASGAVRFFSGEWRAALQELDQAEVLLRERCRAVAWELNNTQSWACNALILMGQLGESAHRVTLMLSDARERGDRWALMNTIYPTAITALVADQPGRVRDALESIDLPHKHYTPGHWAALVSQISLARYQGRGRDAWSRVDAEWRRMERSQLLRVRMIHSCGSYEKALCALSAAEEGGADRSLLRSARALAKTLDGNPLGHAAPMAAAIRAGAAALDGDRRTVETQLRTAVDGFECEDMGYLAACSRHQLGLLLGGDEGARLVAVSAEFFRKQGVKSVERCLAMSAPGFGRLLGW